jgi:hypothetical protein
MNGMDDESGYWKLGRGSIGWFVVRTQNMGIG